MNKSGDTPHSTSTSHLPLYTTNLIFTVQVIAMCFIWSPTACSPSHVLPEKISLKLHVPEQDPESLNDMCKVLLPTTELQPRKVSLILAFLNRRFCLRHCFIWSPTSCAPHRMFCPLRQFASFEAHLHAFHPIWIGSAVFYNLLHLKPTFMQGVCMVFRLYAGHIKDLHTYMQYVACVPWPPPMALTSKKDIYLNYTDK